VVTEQKNYILRRERYSTGVGFSLCFMRFQFVLSAKAVGGKVETKRSIVIRVFSVKFAVPRSCISEGVRHFFFHKN
jgi:hypothetical protein